MKIWDRMSLLGRREIYYYDTQKGFETEDFAKRLLDLITQVQEEKKKDGVIFLCIGTDRSTGDSLGPLIGYKLQEKKMDCAKVVGTLEKPVHAMNLDEYLHILNTKYPEHVIVALDASVGSRDHVGYITLGKGALKPGLGVSKELRAVGDVFITGIVGGCGNYDPLMLQSIRLSTVMKLADYISESIFIVEKFWENAALV